jgi:hypothetical protein
MNSTSIEPPTPSAEQLADWQALIERIRQGDRFQVVAWDKGAVAGTALLEEGSNPAYPMITL